MAYRTVIIARWYIYLSVMQWSQFFSTSQTHSIPQSPSLILSIKTTFQFLNPNVRYFQSKSLCNVQVPTIYNSTTFHRRTYQHRCQSTTPIYIPLFQENHHHQIGYYIMYEVSLYKNNRVWKAPDSLFFIKITFKDFEG